MDANESQSSSGSYLSQRECERLFESDKAGVLYIRPWDATIVKINPYLAEILKYDSRDVQGKCLASLGARPDEAANQEQVRHLLNDGYL